MSLLSLYFGRIITLIGMIVLLHTGYSANHYKNLVFSLNLQATASFPTIDVSNLL